MKTHSFLPPLDRIASALEQLVPKPTANLDIKAANGFIWQGDSNSFTPVALINAINLDFLIGLDLQKSKLESNTRSFAKGYPANNALLWGARGMGKSSMIKAIHQKIANEAPNAPNDAPLILPLILIEILREDLTTLNSCLAQLKDKPARFILFCDDLSFDQQDQSYKSLKALLEGGLAGRPENVLFYATSNQRHLLNRSQREYDTVDAIHGNDITNETISLSDRFGLWLGFHNCSPEDYKNMIKTYASHYKIPLDEEELLKQAHQWSMERGSRSGRVAWQYIQHALGQHNIKPT